ncbi:MAG: hypothetical protein COA52_13025 [Hyphomicrobiales bacterium]|nr:MAG: hypothetical protein COA52_13025 [Hyphomicrobiales bacterium]
MTTRQTQHRDAIAEERTGWALPIGVGAAMTIVFAVGLALVTLPLKSAGIGLAYHVSGDSAYAITALAQSDARYVSATRFEGLIAIFVPSAKTLEKLNNSGFLFVLNAEAGCLRWTTDFAQIRGQNRAFERI